MIVALAGRRIDAAGSADVRFPLINQHRVGVRIAVVLERLGVDALVCAAACGADLLALEAAAELGVRRRVVLPYEPRRFRESSVTDRPGDWGLVYDRVIAEVSAVGDLVVMDPVQDELAYAAANRAILQEALALATESSAASNPADRPNVVAVIVWEGAPRGDDDMTQHFADQARALGLRVEEVLTI